MSSLNHSLRYKVLCVSSNQMAPDYDHLTLMQKVEVFEHALSNTNGDDLAKLLWLKSPSSEVLIRSKNCLCVNFCLLGCWTAKVFPFLHHFCVRFIPVFP